MISKTDKGFFAPIVVLIVLIIISLIVLSTRLKPATPSPTVTPSPLIVPTATPTIVPTIKATATPTIKPATPKPSLLVISGPPGAGYSRVTVHTEKGDFTASILSIDLNSSKMVTDSANDNDCATGCTTITLQDFVNRNGGFAGVNGTYFCPATYPDCASKTDSYDFPIWNTRLNHWINGGNLSWNARSIFYADGSGAHYLQNANNFGGGLNAGIVNFPGLLSDGNVQIDDNQSGLSDKQKGVNSKTGIGLIDPKHIMVVIASAVNMEQFGYVFKALGARFALNLDNGGSTALYYNGRYMAGPGRNIPNAIIFTR